MSAIVVRTIYIGADKSKKFSKFSKKLLTQIFNESSICGVERNEARNTNSLCSKDKQLDKRIKTF